MGLGEGGGRAGNDIGEARDFGEGWVDALSSRPKTHITATPHTPAQRTQLEDDEKEEPAIHLLLAAGPGPFQIDRLLLPPSSLVIITLVPIGPIERVLHPTRLSLLSLLSLPSLPPAGSGDSAATVRGGGGGSSCAGGGTMGRILEPR